MKNELTATRSQSFPTSAFAGAGFCAVGESSLALLWRRVRATGVKGVVSHHCEEHERRSNLGLFSESCHSERSEESSRSATPGGAHFTRTAPTTALLSRGVREAGGMDGFSRHSERSERSAPDDSKLVDPSHNRLRMTDGKNTKEQIAAQKKLAMTELSGPRCTKTAPTTRTPLQVAG